MRLYEIIGYECGSVHYDPAKKTMRTHRNKTGKITLRSLRKMNLLKKRQQKINKKKSLLVGLMYGNGSIESETEMSLAAAELKAQSHIDDLAMKYVNKSY